MRFGRIHVAWLGAGRWGRSRWRLLEDFHVLDDEDRCWTVPVGQETDGASVPILLWPLINPTGSVWPAALLHDYLYRNFGPSAWADRLLRQGMKARGMWIRAPLAYVALRIVNRIGSVGPTGWVWASLAVGASALVLAGIGGQAVVFWWGVILWAALILATTVIGRG